MTAKLSWSATLCLNWPVFSPQVSPRQSHPGRQACDVIRIPAPGCATVKS